MIDSKVKVTIPQVVIQRVAQSESREMVAELSKEYANQARIAIIRAGKIATAKTLQSVKDNLVLYSPVRDHFQRNVTANNSIAFIISGRKAGKKPPPVNSPEMQEWFAALSIPREAWYPIAISIGRKGIRPVDVQATAFKASQPRFIRIIQYRARNIAQKLFQ